MVSEVDARALAPAPRPPSRWLPLAGRIAGSPVARAILLVVLLGIGSVSLASQWHEVGPKIGAMNPAAVVAAFLLGLTPTVAGGLAWRVLLREVDVAPPVAVALSAAGIGQIGKYLPGSVWPVFFQAELVRPYGVRRDRSAASGLLVVAIQLLGGLFLGAVVLLAAHQAPWFADVGLVLLAIGSLCCLHPVVVNRFMGLALRLGRSPALDRPVATRATVTVFLLCVATAGALGLHAYVLARQFGPASVTGAVGGFLLAWAAGFLVPFLPAGGGVREALLYATLGTTIGHAGALGMAAVSRALLVAVDLTACLVALLARRLLTRGV